jgi:hypothetical protein
MFCWLMGLLVLGTLLVCVADVFQRSVDVPFVKLAKKLESKCCISEERGGEESLPLSETPVPSPRSAKLSFRN